MNEDLKELLRLFNSQRVEYLVIGAHALAFHGLPRYTEDLDLWLNRTEENAHRLAQALAAFGLPMSPQAEQDFVGERKMIRLGNPPNRVDLLNFGPNLPFEEVWNRKLVADFDGVTVNMISREDFVRAKRDAGRPKDLRDLEELGDP